MDRTEALRALLDEAVRIFALEPLDARISFEGLSLKIAEESTVVPMNAPCFDITLYPDHITWMESGADPRDGVRSFSARSSREFAEIFIVNSLPLELAIGSDLKMIRRCCMWRELKDRHKSPDRPAFRHILGKLGARVSNSNRRKLGLFLNSEPVMQLCRVIDLRPEEPNSPYESKYTKQIEKIPANIVRGWFMTAILTGGKRPGRIE